MLRQGSPEEAGVSLERVAALRELCSSWVADRLSPAVSVLAARQGVIFLHDAWGYLSPGGRSGMVSLESLFGMASCSKTVTAAAVMILVEEGLLGLDEPLQRYLPEFQQPEGTLITIRQLLSHTAGLPPAADEDILQVAAGGLDYPPGTRMVYSSVGYDLLGLLVEKISGHDFPEFTARRIFQPLGMKNTTFVHLGLDRERCVRRRPGTTYDWPVEMEGRTSASSSLWSTASDMGILLQTFLNGGSYGDFRLLDESTVGEMTRSQVDGLPRELVSGVPVPPAGLGWFLVGRAQFPDYPDSFSPLSYGHSGASGAFIWVDPAYQLIGAFLFVKISEDFRPLDLFVDAVVDSIRDR